MPALCARRRREPLDRATASRPEKQRALPQTCWHPAARREMRAVLRDRETGWGGVIFFRETSAPDFTDDEVAFVRSLAEDLPRDPTCLLQSELAHRDGDSVPGCSWWPRAA